MKNKKVLILGGAGFIGLGIAKYLGENRDYKITIADIFSSGQKDSDFNTTISDYNINYIEGDFTPLEKSHWNTLFTSPIEPLTSEEKQEFLSKITGVSVASDAFFPFRDNIDHCSKHGVSCIIQPGGSIADAKIIEACNEYNMVMAFSTKRVFTH